MRWGKEVKYMKREALEEIIGEINDNIYSSDLTSAKFEERVANYENENGKVDLVAINAWAMQEARDYTTIFVHDLLLRLSDEGYLNDPVKKN